MVLLLDTQITLNVSLQDHYLKQKLLTQLAEPKFIGKHENGNDIYLKNGRFGPYLQYEKIPTIVENEKNTKKEKLKNLNLIIMNL